MKELLCQIVAGLILLFGLPVSHMDPPLSLGRWLIVYISMCLVLRAGWCLSLKKEPEK